MPDRETVFDALRNCITEPKCKDCPWEQCEQFNQKKVTIPATLALDVLNLLKEQEAVKPTWQQGKAFCGSCGRRIPLKIGARFCHKCGRQVSWK